MFSAHKNDAHVKLRARLGYLCIRGTRNARKGQQHAKNGCVKIGQQAVTCFASTLDCVQVTYRCPARLARNRAPQPDQRRREQKRWPPQRVRCPGIRCRHETRLRRAPHSEGEAPNLELKRQTDFESSTAMRITTRASGKTTAIFSSSACDQRL
jgi:hypothetical protein